MAKACPLPNLEYSEWCKKKGIPLPKAPEVLPSWKEFKAQTAGTYNKWDAKYMWLKAKSQTGKLSAKQITWLKKNADKFEAHKLPKILGTKAPVKSSKATTFLKGVYEDASPVKKEQLLHAWKVQGIDTSFIKKKAGSQSWAAYKKANGIEKATLAVKKKHKLEFLQAKGSLTPAQQKFVDSMLSKPKGDAALSWKAFKSKYYGEKDVKKLKYTYLKMQESSGKALTAKQAKYLANYDAKEVLPSKGSMKDWNKWMLSLSTEEKTAIYSWKNSSNAIRAQQLYEIGKHKTGGAIRKARNLSTAFARAPKYKGVVYRGDDLAEHLLPKVGDIQKWNTNHCTSKNISVAKKFSENVIYRIEIKNGMDIHRIDGYRNEAEVMGMRGAKYKCTAVTKQGRKTIVDLKEL